MSPIIYLGNSCIGLAIALSLFGMIFFYVARQIQSEGAAAFGRASLYGNFILMTIANYAMIYALLTNDFAVSYVAHVGSRETPRWISAISLWSSLEGSILFWGWLLSAYAAVCTYVYRADRASLMPWVGFTLLFVQLFFFILLALPASPFQAVFPVPANGPGPNPLLQNHWLMAVHPPCLYIGYIGFTVPFAFAVAALLEASDPLDFLVRAKHWILFAWSFLSIAIILGGWWSYAVLGWGGYWAWDPVENASFMPWLSATALVHSLIVQERRRLFSMWNVILAIVTFLLTLLGTFLTRSGILDSVHSFTESHIGPYFLVFIGIILAASLALLLWKGGRFRDAERIEHFFSLEVLFLFNNLLFVSFCFVVLLGTLYPLIAEAVKGSRISVGQPYFNQMTVPIVGLILLLMGIGLITPWKQGSGRLVKKFSLLPAALALLTTGISYFLGARHPWVVVIVLLASFAFFIMVLELVRMGRQRSLLRLLQDNPRRYGGFISHLGMLFIIVAVGLSSVYKEDRQFTLKQGQSVQVKGYTLTLKEMTGEQVPQRFEIKGHMDVARNNQSLGELAPQMNFYAASREPIGSPAVRSTLIEDLYLTLISFEKDGSALSLRVVVTPAVAWIWIGGVVVMLGGLVSLVLKKEAA